jgi:PAT family beta-lactamase induction signal transducer AmpG
MWLFPLYFAKGMPHVVVTVIAVVLFRQLRLSSSEITFLVAWFYLPWVLKPWWKPFTDRALNSRQWVMLTELLLLVVFAALAFSLASIPLVFLLLWLIAWLNAIHNVGVDTYYRQEFNAGRYGAYRHVRELARKSAVVVGQGIIVMLAGNLQVIYRNNIRFSWSLMFYCLAGLFLLLLLWHGHIMPAATARRSPLAVPSTVSLSPRTSFFLLCFGLSPAFLSKVSFLFLLDVMRNGGLGLSPQEFGLVMGSVGILGLTLGGILGTKAMSRWGVSRLLRWMAGAVAVPGVVYLLLSLIQPSKLPVISLCVFIEQFSFGFGYAAYLAVLRQLPVGELKKSLMALSMLIPCLFSGFVVEQVGYVFFFALACLLSLVSFASTISFQHEWAKKC